MFPGNQHSLFVPVCKKILNLRVRCLYGNRDESKLLQAYCECELIFLGLIWQGMHELHVATLLCLGKFQCPCSGDLGHCAA